MELLVARGLTQYKDGEKLFGPVDLTVVSGMRLALTGRSGSGRGLLLRMLAGRLAPAEGTISRAPGILVSLAADGASGAERRTGRQIALAGLERLRQLEAQLRATELRLTEPGALQHYGRLSDEFEALGGYGAEQELFRQLSGFGLTDDLLDLPAGRLSGGQRRRLQLAVALAQRPDLLLLEAPEAGLDQEARELLVRALKRFPGAVIFSSHDRQFMNDAARLVGELSVSGLQVRKGGFPRRPLKKAAADDGGRRRLLLSAEPLKLPVGQRMLSSGAWTVHSGDKIVLLGENGSGKSTLLAHIARDLHGGQGDSGLHWHGRVHLSYYAQDTRGLDLNLSALENLERLMNRQRARQLLGLVRLEHPLWHVPVAELSPGRRAQVGLARLLADDSDLLLVDELDAGLDLHGITLLEDSLASRTGAVIVVSHDRQLADNLALRVWSLEPEGLRDYRGGMDGFRGGRLRREPGLSQAIRPEAEQQEPAGGQPASLEQLEDELAALDLRLDDTLDLSERQLLRLQRRRAVLLDLLSERYDAGFPAAEPRFRTREAGLKVQADLSETGDSLDFTELDGCRPQLLVRGAVAHLTLKVPADRCLLPKARAALLNGAARLAFYALDVRVVQYWDPVPPPGLLLEPAGPDWHALARARFEQLENWLRPESPGRRKRRRRRRRRRQGTTGG